LGIIIAGERRMSKRKEREGEGKRDAFDEFRKKRAKASPPKVITVFDDSDLSSDEDFGGSSSSSSSSHAPVSKTVVHLDSEDDLDSPSSDEDEKLMRMGVVDDLENGDDELYYTDPDDHDGDSDGDLKDFIGTHEDDEDDFRINKTRKKKRDREKPNGKRTSPPLSGLGSMISKKSKTSSPLIDGSDITHNEYAVLLDMVGDLMETYASVEVKSKFVATLEQLWGAFRGDVRRVRDHPGYSRLNKRREKDLEYDVLPIIVKMEKYLELFEKVKRMRSEVKMEVEDMVKAHAEAASIEGLHESLSCQ